MYLATAVFLFRKIYFLDLYPRQVSKACAIVCMFDIASAHGGLSRTDHFAYASFAKLSLRLWLVNR